MSVQSPVSTETRNSMNRLIAIVLSMFALSGCTALVVGGAEGGYEPCEQEQSTDEECKESR